MLIVNNNLGYHVWDIYYRQGPRMWPGHKHTQVTSSDSLCYLHLTEGTTGAESSDITPLECDWARI